MRLAFELLESTIQQDKVDRQRVYILGLSMGGFGTWDAIQRKPNTFAAAIPICGGGDAQQAPKLKDLPIWVWHGDQDKAIDVIRSRNMIKAITQAGGTPRYTELPGVGHNAWTPASESDELWTWLFSQKKS